MKPLLLMQTGDAPDIIRQEQANFAGMFLQQGNIDAERVHIVHLPSGEQPLPPVEYCGVVITGSPAMVTEQLPWSEQAAAWLRQAMLIRLPLFGVCYGHQLLAYALGGEVGYHPQGMEVGTLDVELLPAAAEDRRLALLPPRFKANLIHAQSVLTPPAGAQALARSQQDAYQILRYGDHALTTQFHPEFNGAVMHQYLNWLGELHPEQREQYQQKQQQVSDTPFSRLLLQGFVVSLGAQKALAG
ncbi:GMP synthase [glutamine-hydrolyzing] [Serratia entomophila]|jgi:GMP synthase (glutamine-hydrolysing)|uniref:Glutamine amidotransferase n=1 Tax=Serratia entomophila TaxID=42906 RepID=A0ABY5CRF9_9GAMM|nr:glutamine amidotransferase [Serratia entomophila]UIW17843.1 glutamine amidotransferase [Serratia entomophila]USV00438.1 glutamine amidotransferase [Serratia entomophila]CAI0699386.1 GMP synthase [glutamine-hydrolyzing] [Serratia entomophila]CAI0758432.1 GMP synthase [glutamine-hydrolyzing] [Serratia entomophila]CAI0920695.1 GMP synthase [glutamine-hydrolyzing] [Serratia entomophila]